MSATAPSSTASPPAFDVLICGYGPTGATAANLLGQRGVRCLVIDKSDAIYQIPRAVHYDGECARIFQGIGLAEQVASVSGHARALRFINGSGRLLFETGPGDMPMRHAWGPANFFNQPMLEAFLRRGVERFPNVEVRLGCELVAIESRGDRVTVGLKNLATGAESSIDVGYVLGCDGANSRVRSRFGVELDSFDCDEAWLVCDQVYPEGTPFERITYQICDPARPTTIVPCEGQHLRWEFMLDADEDAADLERPERTFEMMQPHMPLVAKGTRAEDGKLLRSKAYTFHALVAKQWRVGEGRAFLLGDAAHQMPPFLGQGMCAGIRDASNLCWKIAGVVRGDFDASILDTYQSEREAHARAVVAQAVSTGKVIQARSRLRAALRDFVFAVGRLLPGLAPAAIEFGWAQGDGFFGAETPPTLDSPHGNPIDQPFVVRGGARLRLDEVLGRDFAVVVLDCDIDEATRAKLEASGLALCRVGRRGSGADVEDIDGDLAAYFERTGGGVAAIVRPDRIVYDVCPEEELDTALCEAAATLAARLHGRH